jgi:signal transduction histidine kinase
MSKIPFVISARTAKLIGQENFTNAEGAIVELVKNGYDADAKNAIIIFDDREENSSGHSVYIIDNGSGMTADIIKQKWMKIGTDDKLQNFMSDGGRIKSGAKGIGRFALDRLGVTSEMFSRAIKTKNDELDESSIETDNLDYIGEKVYENIFWSVQWSDFETSKLISEVGAELDIIDDFDIKKFVTEKFLEYDIIKKTIDKIDFQTGTVLKISLLRDNWDDNFLKSLFNNLEMLIPPIEQPEFSIHLFSTSEINDYGEVNGAYYDDYDYKISANFTGGENSKIKVSIDRNELELETLEVSYQEIFQNPLMQSFPFNLETFKAKTFTQEFRLNEIKGFSSVDLELIKRLGDFEFIFYFLKNKYSDDKNEGDLKKYPYRKFIASNRSAWLKKFGGVKIFRDDFRVRPYGENGDDWLKLGERQAKSPQGAGQRIGQYRIRPNQIAGTIKISRVNNPYLIDKSGREGIQENDVFGLFKNLLEAIINIFERDRNIVMFSLSELAKQRFADEEEKRKAQDEADRVLKEQEEQEIAARDKKEGDVEVTTEGPSETEKILAKGTKILQQELEEKESEIQMLRNLASTGLIISSFAHEVKSLRSRLIPRTEYLNKELKKLIKDEDLKEVDKEDNPFYMLSLIQEEDLKLKHWLDYSLNSLKRDKRTRTNINFGEYFEKFKLVWSKALSQRKVDIKLIGDKNPSNVIQAFEVDLDSIFNNLLSNSLNAFKGKENIKEKEIHINWRSNNGVMEIDFIDNGAGLAEEYKKNPNEIFNPHETSRRDRIGNVTGTGLGLYIVKSIVDDYNNATIDVGEIKDGFLMKLTFPIRKKE